MFCSAGVEGRFLIGTTLVSLRQQQRWERLWFQLNVNRSQTFNQEDRRLSFGGLLREPGKLLKGRGVDDLWRYWLCYQLFNSSSAPRVMAAERQREGERI